MKPTFRRLIVFYIPLFMFVFAMLFPFLWMFITSIKPDPELYNPRLSPFIVRDPTLEHWKALFSGTLFWDWTINTLWVAIASTSVSLFAGILAGYSLSRFVFPGSTIFGIAIFVTYLVPPTLLFIPLTGVDLLDGSAGHFLVPDFHLSRPFWCRSAPGC